MDTLLLYLHISPVYGPVIPFNRPSSKRTSKMQHIHRTQNIAKSTDALVKVRRYIVIILMGQILHLFKSVEPMPLSTMRLKVQS